MTKSQITQSDENLIREWLNCAVAEVDENGDVWVAEPMTGHWLSEDKKAEYIEFRRSVQGNA